jgi:hypothetical protein
MSILPSNLVTNLNSNAFDINGGQGNSVAVAEDNQNNYMGSVIQQDSVNYEANNTDANKQKLISDEARYIQPMIDLMNSTSTSATQKEQLQADLNAIFAQGSSQTGDSNFGQEVMSAEAAPRIVSNNQGGHIN